MDNSYSKIEKLKSQKLIDSIFAERHTYAQFPLRVFWSFPKEKMDCPLKAGVGCSKKYFKKAVHRNRVKRLIREAWRLNKQPLQNLIETNGTEMILFFHFSDRKLPEWVEVENKMKILINKLICVVNAQLEKNS